MLGVAFGDVETQQLECAQLRLDLRCVEYFMLDDFAADAPVGVPVEQDRLPRSFRLGQGRIKCSRRSDGLPGIHRSCRTIADGCRRWRRQWAQRVALAIEGAVPAGQAVDQQGQAQQLRQALAWRLDHELQRPKENGYAYAQETDQQQGRRPRQHAAEQADGEAQQQYTNGVFHGVQPRPALWQPGRTPRGHQQQWRAHAQAEGKQLECTAQGVTAGTDIQQGAGQWCRDARRNQQAGEHAQHCCAQQRAALGAVGERIQAIAQGLWQFEFEQAEHGQGEQYEEQRERHQHPNRLQPCLQVQACTEQAHQRAQQGETGGHGQHIGQRQGQAAQAGDLAAQDHAREDRQHRQHAGREGQADPGEEEQQQ
ncbi:hypothetical protein D3C81_907970 [compost metagenome]